MKEETGESRNHADSEPTKPAARSAKLTAWREEIETRETALIPEPNPEYVP